MERGTCLNTTCRCIALIDNAKTNGSIWWACVYIRWVVEEAEVIANTSETVKWGMSVKIYIKYRRLNALLVYIFINTYASMWRRYKNEPNNNEMKSIRTSWTKTRYIFGLLENKVLEKNDGSLLRICDFIFPRRLSNFVQWTQSRWITNVSIFDLRQMTGVGGMTNVVIFYLPQIADGGGITNVGIFNFPEMTGGGGITSLLQVLGGCGMKMMYTSRILQRFLIIQVFFGHIYWLCVGNCERWCKKSIVAPDVDEGNVWFSLRWRR